jgi:hypothetical protein
MTPRPFEKWKRVAQLSTKYTHRTPLRGSPARFESCVPIERYQAEHRFGFRYGGQSP